MKRKASMKRRTSVSKKTMKYRRMTVKRKVKKRVYKKKVSSKSSNFNVAISRLRKLKASQQRKAVQIASPKFVRHLCNEVRKMRYQKLKPALAKKFRKHAVSLRKLVGKKTSVNSKREILTQRGGLIGALLAGLAPSIIGLTVKAVRSLMKK